MKYINILVNKSKLRSGFRADINGLRAWAVVSVIFYHFGFSGFGGGFVGVDIFFVISGFLMTNIVVKGLEQGNFSLLNFYLARARRIIPALVILCFVLLVYGYRYLLPPDYRVLGTHAISALLFFSNLKFLDEAGYFDAASHDKWLLHTWSLSVEWQFYILLPIALLLVWRLKPGRLFQIYVIVFFMVVSFASSILMSVSHPADGFFLLQNRAWEMLAGGLVFMLHHLVRVGGRFGFWLEKIGFALIVFSITYFDSASLWPGWRALLPVTGASMVLLANRTSYWTCGYFAQWLGARSYSLYLWHWPVYVGLAYAELQYSAIAISFGLLLTLVLGEISCRFVEVPSRNFIGKLRHPVATGFIVITLFLLLFPSIIIRLKDGVSGRFNLQTDRAAAEVMNVNSRRNECHPKSGNTSPSCLWGGKDWRVIALGDSHAASLITAIAESAKPSDAGLVQWTYSGCAYVPGLIFTPDIKRMFDRSYQCLEFIEWAKLELKSVPGNIPVIIAGRYAGMAFGSNISRVIAEKPSIYFTKYYPRTNQEFLTEFGKYVTDAACDLAKNRLVYLMRPIPEMGFNVPRSLGRRLALGLSEDVSIPLSEYMKRNAWVWAAQDAARDKCGIRILDPIPYLCHDGQCFGSKEGRPLYTDDNHLSEFGNKLLVPMFRSVYEDL